MGFKEKQAKTLAEILKLNCEDNTVYGVYKDFHFSINLVPYGNASIWQLTMLLDKVLSNENEKRLKKVHKVNILYKSINITPTVNVVAYNIMLNMPLSKDKKIVYFEILMDALTETLKDENILELNSCGLCAVDNNDEELTYKVYKGLYLPVHLSGLEKNYEEQKREIMQENANIKKLPISIILAIVGAIIGIIPSVIVIYGFGYLFALLFALSPFCAFFGYKLGKAPLRWYATLIATIASLIATVIGVIAPIALLAAAAQMDLATFINDPELGFYSLLLQALLFDVIGVGVSWGYITKTRSNKVK